MIVASPERHCIVFLHSVLHPIKEGDIMNLLDRQGNQSFKELSNRATLLVSVGPGFISGLIPELEHLTCYAILFLSI